MSSDEGFGRADAEQVRERLLSGYVNIWEEVFETGSFCGWAYDKRISKLYIHGAPRCGKVSLYSQARSARCLRREDDILGGRRRKAHIGR
jgi:hypothetical protein